MPIVLQRAQTDCSLAALAMIAGAWGRSWSVSDMARHLRPTENGVRLGALRDLARARGLVAIAINPRDGAVVTIDPATGDMLKRSREVVDLEWKHAGYATLVIVADRAMRRTNALAAGTP